jgi:hypothetical protein
MAHTGGTIVCVVVVIGQRSAVAVAEKSEIERVILIDFAILRPHLHAFIQNSGNVARAGKVAHIGPRGGKAGVSLGKLFSIIGFPGFSAGRR